MKDSINFDGKIYISSRRAAEMSKYSNDYIGQLCRGGKVVSRMVGRTWFVDKDSLFVYKRTAEEAFRNRCRDVSRDQEKILNSAPNAVNMLQVAVPAVSPIEWTFTYESDNGPLLPEIRKAFPKLPQFSQKIKSENSNVLFKRSLMFFLIVTIFITGGFIVNQNYPIVSNIFNTQFESQLAKVPSSIGYLSDYILQNISTRMNGILAFFKGDQYDGLGKYTSDNNSSIDSQTVSDSKWNGIAVIRSTDDNEKTLEKISNSFSDNVTVNPDESGTSGIITPIFKRTTGDDFMYVLVPVKEKDDSGDSTQK